MDSFQIGYVIGILIVIVICGVIGYFLAKRIRKRFKKDSGLQNLNKQAQTK